MSSQNSKIVEFFRKIGNAVLGIKSLPSKLKGSKPKLGISTGKEEIPSLLRGFMQERDAGWPEYVILKTQIAIIILFGASVVLSFSWISPLILTPVIGGLIGYLIYLTPTQLKSAFRRDYLAYRTFVGLSIAISLALIFLRKLLENQLIISSTSPYRNLIPVVLVLGTVFLGFIAFRVKYGRNYTYGTVKEVKESKAVVKINYDIKSNVKNGLYLLDSLKEVQPKDEVKIGVNRSMWGLRGSEPTAILEKMQ